MKNIIKKYGLHAFCMLCLLTGTGFLMAGETDLAFALIEAAVVTYAGVLFHDMIVMCASDGIEHVSTSQSTPGLAMSSLSMSDQLRIEEVDIEDEIKVDEQEKRLTFDL